MPAAQFESDDFRGVDPNDAFAFYAISRLRERQRPH